jgi:hypothetical protein
MWTIGAGIVISLLILMWFNGHVLKNGPNAKKTSRCKQAQRDQQKWSEDHQYETEVAKTALAIPVSAWSWNDDGRDAVPSFTHRTAGGLIIEIRRSEVEEVEHNYGWGGIEYSVRLVQTLCVDGQVADIPLGFPLKKQIGELADRLVSRRAQSLSARWSEEETRRAQAAAEDRAQAQARAGQDDARRLKQFRERR